jgi:transcription initiation factor TFIID subunit TAF12
MRYDPDVPAALAFVHGQRLQRTVNGHRPQRCCMEESQNCPKCSKTTRMEKIKTETVIPAVLDPKSKRQGSPISAKTGLPVQVFVCPACRFVELYYSGSSYL